VEALNGALEVTGALMEDALKLDQPRIIGCGTQQRGENGRSISQPAGCEMLEDEVGGQCLLLEGRGAGNLLRTVRRELIRNSGVRCTSAKECTLETCCAETAAVISGRNPRFRRVPSA